MFDLDDAPTDPAPLDFGEDFTPRELHLLGEAVGQGVTAATGMLCVAEFIPSAGVFLVRPAAVAAPGDLH